MAKIGYARVSTRDQNLDRQQQCLIWVKDHFVLGRQDYQWQHEPCLYGWKLFNSYQSTNQERSKRNFTKRSLRPS